MHKSGQASTGEPADTDLLVHGKRVDFHMLDLASSIGADIMIVDPTAPACIERGCDEAAMSSECEDGKRKQSMFLNTASMVLGDDYF